jgi:hypothetical protein
MGKSDIMHGISGA